MSQNANDIRVQCMYDIFKSNRRFFGVYGDRAKPLPKNYPKLSPLP